MAARSNGVSPASDWVVPPDEQQGLRRYVATLRERWKLILGITALTTLAAIAYVLVVSKTYEAESRIQVSPVSASNDTLQGLGLIEASSDPTRDVQTVSELITTLEVADIARKEIDYPGTADALLATITAEPVAQSNIVAITASAGDPDEAAEIANAFAEAFIKQRDDQLHELIDQNLQNLKGLDQTASDRARISELERLRAAPDPTVRFSIRATPPASPVAPKPVLSVLAGIIAGLVLGIAAAFATQILDPRLRREEQLRMLYRIPIIGRIPREPKEAADRPLGPRLISPAVAEAYRTLRGTVTASTRGAGARVLLVTGSSPSEGKTTTAINLAASLSSTGRRVILIEADLRRPAISRALSVEPRRGVVGVLIESVSLEDALIDGDAFGLPNLKMLLAENEGGWISELFSLPTAIDMLQRAKELAEYVIIDSPPLTDVVDALPLARNVDDVLVVVRPGTTRISKLTQLGELLSENGIRPMGFAVVGTPPPGRGESTYYFDHREGFEEQMPESARSGGATPPA
jgi:tyrosine-protein kinase